MNRELRMVIVADTNNAEAREVIAQLSTDAAIPQTVVTPQLVRRILPIRANPAVGVMLWSNDLQGVVADVAALAAYLKGEAEIKAATDTLMHTAPDAVVLSVPDAVCPTWTAGATYAANAVVLRLGQKYRVVNGVTAQAHQPPEMEGMLAVYRPIVPEHAGTPDDPIPWVYGMDCAAGAYYSHEGRVYKALQNMQPCTWAPGCDGTAAIWEVVSE